MSIDAGELASYLRCLAVDEDGDHWKDGCLARIINESVIALAMQRPEYFSDVKELTADSSGVISLPDGYDSFVSVQGIKKAGETAPCTGLKMMSLADAIDADGCWRCKDTEAQSVVWDAVGDPTRLYLNGTLPAGATVSVTVAKCPPKITDLNGTIDVPCTFMPQLVDWALHRMYDRIDSASGKQAMHYNHWERYGMMSLNVMMARSKM